MIIVPTIASTIAAVDIINNAKHRDLLENYCPLFGRPMNAFVYLFRYAVLNFSACVSSGPGSEIPWLRG